MHTKLADVGLHVGLMRRHNTELEFVLSARMIVALSFVPIDGFDAVLEVLVNEIPLDLMTIMDWFETLKTTA